MKELEGNTMRPIEKAAPTGIIIVKAFAQRILLAGRRPRIWASTQQAPPSPLSPPLYRSS
jgi:hypothetical protein